MVEEHPTGGGELYPPGVPLHKGGADLVLQVAHLAAEGGLGGVQPCLGRNRQAAGLGDGDEIAKVAKLHRDMPPKYIQGATKSYSWRPRLPTFPSPARQAAVA